MHLLLALFAITALLGHAAIWIAWINRFHSRLGPRWLFHLHDITWIGMFAGIPGIVSLALFYRWQTSRLLPVFDYPWSWPILLYGSFCSGMLVVILLFRIWRSRHQMKLNPSIQESTEVVHLGRSLGASHLTNRITHLCAAVPGNQILQLAVEKKTISAQSLAKRLTIAHLSDLHITGQLSQAFYEAIVQQTNALDADIIVITGDILDEAKYMAWLGETLGQLRARHGVYFVLGNHDRYSKQPEAIRQSLESVGMKDVGSQAIMIDIAGEPILLAGNELPWFSPAADMENYHDEKSNQAYRILLSHSPDQIAWARSHAFDLMLAGHCHGGQFRLPFIGAFLTPSRYGTRFASGLFYLEPTLLHVSRGISGTRPFRFNCRPEITLLELCLDKNRP